MSANAPEKGNPAESEPNNVSGGFYAPELCCKYCYRSFSGFDVEKKSEKTAADTKNTGNAPIAASGSDHRRNDL